MLLWTIGHAAVSDGDLMSAMAQRLAVAEQQLRNANQKIAEKVQQVNLYIFNTSTTPQVLQPFSMISLKDLDLLSIVLTSNVLISYLVYDRF